MIDGVGNASPYSQSGSAAGVGNIRQAVLSSASSALDVSSQDLAAALASGQSLAQVAQQQGVSNDTLVSAVAAGIQSATGTSSSDSTQATKVAQQIVNRHGGGGHHHHHAPSTDAADSTDPNSTDATDPNSPLAALASVLGMSQSDVQAALVQSGSSIGDLLDQQGVSPQDVDPSVTEGLIVDTSA